MATRRRLRQLSGALSLPAPPLHPTQLPVAAGGSAAETEAGTEPTPAQRFLFDTQGYLLLHEVSPVTKGKLAESPLGNLLGRWAGSTAERFDS